MAEKNKSRANSGSFKAFLCNLIGFLMLAAVIATALPLTIPRYMGYEIYEVISGSMEPSIPVGSVVYVSATAPEDVKEGEVIAFTDEGSVVTHRVRENRFVVGEFITKGDANAQEDLAPIPYSALIGRVAFSVPVVGRFLAVYASRVGKIYALVFAACGVMFNLLAGRIRERRREKLRRSLESEMSAGTDKNGSGH